MTASSLRRCRRRAIAAPATVARDAVLRAAGCAALITINSFGNVAGADSSAGYDSYLSECSKCHGLTTNGKAAPAVVVAALDARTTASVRGLFSGASHRQLAFALPFGPSLRGIMGRPAGSVAGYEYSQAFLAAMRGTTWDADSIDVYITDSQARAPGARMFYRQADAGVRRRIIKFLAGF